MTRVPLLLIVLSVLLIAFAPFTEAGDLPIWENSVWQAAGRYAGVKPEIVYAIAIRESGMRWKDGKIRPWPWTVNSPRGSMRYANKENAYAAIRRLKYGGVKNIDAGWMQINLQHHGDLVEGLDYMDPKVNILLAGVILKDAMSASNGNVAVAAGRYHSWRVEKGSTYAKRVHAASDAVVELLAQFNSSRPSN